MAFCNQQDPGSRRCLPWSKKGIWSSWPLYSSKNLKMFVYVQNLSTVSFLTSYLQDRTQRVFLSGQYSTEGIVECGIPQGSVLGPLLFCIFINDLPLNITNDNVVCDLFADDNSIHSCGSDLQSVQTSLQEGLNDVSTWCDQNRMVIHPNKTKCMVLTTRQKHQRRPLTLNLTLRKTPVQQVREHRVLGVIIDEELKWQSHIMYVNMYPRIYFCSASSGTMWTVTLVKKKFKPTCSRI